MIRGTHPKLLLEFGGGRARPQEQFGSLLQGDTQHGDTKYAAHGVDRIWRPDLLPCRPYLRHCVLASQNMGPDCHANFLDHTFLGDRTTTIRQHLEADPTIMSELPPESLRERYSG